MEDNVVVFRKDTLKSSGIKDHHVYNLNTTQIVQEKYGYEERGNPKANVNFKHLKIWVKGIWESFVIFLQLFHKSEVTSIQIFKR